MNHFYKTSIFLITNFILLFGGIVNLCSAGDIWSESEIITIEEHAGSYGTPYDMAVDSHGTIHIVYKDSVSGNEVYYLTKTRCGDWSDPERILKGGMNFQMHIDNRDTLHLIWYEAETIVKNHLVLYSILNYSYCYKHTTGDWSNPELFFTGYSTGYSYGVSFVVDNQRTLHIVIGCGDIQEPLNQNPDYIDYQGLYYLKKSADGQWSDIELLTADVPYASRAPSLTLDNTGVLHLVYSNYNNGVYYQYTINENQWSTRLLIPGSTRFTFYPFITIDGDNTIHVVWVHSGVEYTEYTYKEINSAWSQIMKIGNNKSNNPQLIVDVNKNKHFLWVEHISNETEDDLVYKYKPNNGSWYAPEIICNQGPNYPHELSIELDHEGNVYVIWEESGDLYFRTTWVNKAPSVSIQTENIQKRYTKTTYDFYGIVTDDENCNDVYYFIDWGDGNNSGWIGPLNDKNIFQSTHAWFFTGNYTVKIKAKDIQGKESNWSDTVIIHITDEKTPGFEILPLLFTLIMVILWKKKIVCRKK